MIINVCLIIKVSTQFVIMHYDGVSTVVDVHPAMAASCTQLRMSSWGNLWKLLMSTCLLIRASIWKCLFFNSFFLILDLWTIDFFVTLFWYCWLLPSLYNWKVFNNRGQLISKIHHLILKSNQLSDTNRINETIISSFWKPMTQTVIKDAARQLSLNIKQVVKAINNSLPFKDGIYARYDMHVLSPSKRICQKIIKK